MTAQRHDEPSLKLPLGEHEDAAVAAAAARILAAADRAVNEISTEAGRAAAEVRLTTEATRLRSESQHPTEDLRIELEAELRSDRAAMAEISRDLALVHVHLGQISSGIIGLQNHSLRRTGVASLALAVLIAIAWKVIGG